MFSLTLRHPVTVLSPLPRCHLCGSSSSFWSPWLVRGRFASALQAQSEREREEERTRILDKRMSRWTNKCNKAINTSNLIRKLHLFD